MAGISTVISLGFGGKRNTILRENKGKSILDFPEHYTVIDIETTGFDPHYDEIIEVAAIRFVGGKENARFQSLVKPKETVSDFIRDLTGITESMLMDAPELEIVIPEFQDFLGKDILLGHNIHFDINFLYDCFDELELPALSNNFVDTMRLGRRIFPDLSNHKLSTICKHCGVFIETEHRALSDCKRTQECYAYMAQYAEEHGINIKSPSYNAISKSLHPETDQFNPDSPIYGKMFAFTGKLEFYTRKEAMQKVLNAGGLCGDGVTTETNYLVLGNNDYCKAIKEGKSSKQKKAEKLQIQGYDIVTISESVFCDMLRESQKE